MNIFDGVFFHELSRRDEHVILDHESGLMKPADGFPLRVSELHVAGKVSDEFVKLIRNFTDMLAERSSGRYLFEKDFCAYPHCVFSYSQGRYGTKVLNIVFDAYPPRNKFPRPWGVSIGLGFNNRDEHGIIDCADESESFMREIFENKNKKLFNTTFGSLCDCTVNDEDVYKTAKQISPGTPLSYLFFGKRIASDAISAMGTLDALVDECVRVFDVICEAGYFQVDKECRSNRGVFDACHTLKKVK